MLPGFNHNIRYKDRVFHVQTEDNGLKQPRLITQVFIDGHVLALEKSTYDDIIAAAADEKARDDQIRTKMQDQHKQLLKNLVQGSYDGRIEAYLGVGAPTKPTHHEDIPDEVMLEAEALPNAPANPSALTEDVEAIIIAAPEEISPESLLDPDFLLEIGAAVEEETRREPPPRPPTPIAHLTNDLTLGGRSRSQTTEDFLSVLDHEMKKQLPFDPSDEVETEIPRPAGPPERSPVRKTMKVVRGRRERPVSDTLVDFGLPAALRETLERPRPITKTPRPNDTLLDMELRNVAAALRPITEAGNDAKTELARAEAPKDKDGKEIVVVERSLDEVILSYLSDDQDG